MAQLLTTVPLVVPTPVQPANTPVFPTAVLQPNLPPVADISVNTTPDEAVIVESHSEPSENQTRSLDYNMETLEDFQDCVVSHTATVESETQTADPYTTEGQTQTSDPYLVDKSKGTARRGMQEKKKSFGENKQQEQKVKQEQKTDDSLTVKRISRFQVSIVQEDMSVAGKFHCFLAPFMYIVLHFMFSSFYIYTF
jgi:hypothetical protein